MPWTQKYAPKNLEEFVNQKKALEIFLKWIKNWKPGRKALLFHGPPGVGKTALLRAYAKEHNLDFIEMNASDYRSAKQIRQVIGHSMTQQSLFRRGKIFLIDEIDGITGSEDRGGVGEIIKIIKESHFPIVLTANDVWDPKLRSLRNHCILVPFGKIHVWDIVKRLEYICKQEGIKVDKQVLKQIASKNQGDLRGAITDLETVARGKKEITTKDLEVLGFREKETSIFDALKMIFKTQNALAAKLAINTVDKDPEEIFWWIEQNIVNEYEDPEEIAKAFDALSKADLFRQRIISRQQWRFKAYMIDLMTAGVSLAKKQMYRKFTKYQYPDKIKTLGMSKVFRSDINNILSRFSKELHCSTKIVRSEYLPYLKIIMKNPEFRKSIVKALDLKPEEVKLLAS
jgi:replication factor C large subunit